MKKIIFIFSLVIGIMQPLTTYAGEHFKKVFIVVLENTNFQEASTSPFISQLIKEGTILSQFNGEIHPSQGNYIALTSGDFFNITDDDNIDLDVTHIADLLENKGKQWKIYAEDYPGNCFTGARSGNYVRKHNPFISYKNIQSNPKRCSNITNANQLDIDLKNQNLPDYMFYVPNLKNDGHDTGVKYADQWLSKKITPLLKNSAFAQDALFILTFDESLSYKGNHTLSVIWGSKVKSGYDVTTTTNHYNLLRLIEDNFGLGTLGKNDSKASPLDEIWKN